MKIELLTCIIEIALVAAVLYWLPLWRRGNLWFGVTLGPDFRATLEAKKTLRWYRMGIGVLSALALLLTVLAVQFSVVWLLPAAIPLQAIGACAVFAMARRRVWPCSGPVAPPHHK